MIPIFEPKISAKAKINVNKALKDNWISSQGNFINQFEKKLAKFFNNKYAATIINGIMNIELILKIMATVKNKIIFTKYSE